MKEVKIRIVHLTDTHISPFGNFVEKSFDKTVNEINELDPPPTVIVHTGDLTDNGVLPDYELAEKKLEGIEGRLLVSPGNHDERNYGQSLFKELIGRMDYEVKIGGVALYIMNSPEPDRDAGRLGRRRQEFLEERLDRLPDEMFKVIAFHHHLVPIPHAGREMNVLEDAGDILEMVLRHNVDVVLMGHRHVGRVLRIEDTILLNAATTSSIRTRGRLGHSFNIIDLLSDGRMEVSERNVDEGETMVKATFAPKSR